MATKKDLQAQVSELGVEFTQRTTVAQLEALIAEAEVPNTEAANDVPAHPGPNVRFDQGRCAECGKVADHGHA